MKKGNQFLFEISWEVCNKVGGIYTVIRSKLNEVVNNFGENYLLLGPLFEDNPEFYEDHSGDLAIINDQLKQSNITSKVGRWKVDASPKVALIKFEDFSDKDKLLYELWNDYGVDSMSGGWDYIEPVLFSTNAAKAIEVIYSQYEDFNIFAHFHEWMTGAGLLYLRKNVPNIATIFTSHATVLGRSMAGNGVDIYGTFQNIDSKKESAKYNVTAKHTLESASARETDCFTTVSEITGMEATHILHMKPDVILPNGFNVHEIPDYNSNRTYYRKNRKKMTTFASQFLMKDLSEEDTVIISTSGRYEYHNKGIDLLIDTLGELYKEQHELEKGIIVFFFTIGGFVDMSKEKSGKLSGVKERIQKYSMISTHPLWDPYNDPIANECHNKNIQNNPTDRINVIYIPVYLNGRDGVFNMEYYDALSGCDLTIYPSFYEPWGYTPLESAVYSIPTVVSDVAGFGNWIITNKLKGDGIKIVRRFGVNYNDSVIDLKSFILSFIRKDADSINSMKISARRIAEKADWKIFFQNYTHSYDIALKNRNDRLIGRDRKELLKSKELFLAKTYSTRPRFRQFSIQAAIPKEVGKLRELAYNLWWTWNDDACDFFKKMDPELFEELNNNPVAFLESIEIQKLKGIISNKEYMLLYEKVTKEFTRYLSASKPHLDIKYISTKRPVAYFSMEFGFHECMQFYSGGLGILSGDYIKSASDLNMPVVGIGLLYKNGYFKQHISKIGEQIEEYAFNDYLRMPLNELKRENGERLLVKLGLPGRTLYARVWMADIGRAKVYFFDTDIPMNSVSDREITGKLYGGGERIRIEQEILLGIGGVKLLQNELNIFPSVYHINEGHSAFLIIERIINLMKKYNIDIDTAKEVVKASTVFTTHTPVPAGNETFDIRLIENYYSNYIKNTGINLKDIIEMGHIQPSNVDPYEMTVLALNNSYKRNGVSRLHGYVSQNMWNDLWKGFLLEESPIFHITNGVHVPTWLSKEMKELFYEYCSDDLNKTLLIREQCEKIFNIPDDILWQTHFDLKNKFISYVKKEITAHWEREGEDSSLLNKFLSTLNSSCLTIGFGRRITAYKRAALFIKNLDRLRKIVKNEKYPIQFIIAGKAHPDDQKGQDLVKEIVDISKQEDFLGKIVFLEDYDMKIARKMVSGVDVWLNNPRRPLEASGTSGQKAGINGVINFSILDGWWDEGYEGSNGWIIGDRKEYKNLDTQDVVDSNSLYDILENEIIPAYYFRKEKDIPEKWVKIMKNSIVSIISEYNTNRMLRDYVVKMYEPAAKKYFKMFEDDFNKAKEIVQWKKSIKSRFSTIRIKDISVVGIYGDNIDINDEISVTMEVELGKVFIEELRAEMLIFQDKKMENIDYTEMRPERNKIEYITMDAIEENDNSVKYSCKYRGEKSGKYNFGIRVIPYNNDIDDIIDLDLVYWG